MKYLILIIVLFFSCDVYSQKKNNKPVNKDNVEAVYDSLDNVYYFQKVEIQETNKYNFKPGEIPKYEDETYQHRIEALANKSPFNYRYNRIVQNYITMYSKRLKSTGTILSLSKLYFPLYEKYLNQFGIPLELKYLSIVESALNPTAVSPCGAAGLWQFMYGTGKGYKLEINSYIDERFDPEKETIAACQYLKDLYEIYGQWDLAIAAYNCGPGNVNKGIKRAGGKKDFWAIYDYLPKETQGYVPAFIAASYICEYHEEHNIQPANAKFLFDELDVIEINYKVSLNQMSKLLNMDQSQLKYLNPKYITGVVPGNNNLIVVPKQKALEYIDIEIALQNGVKPIIKKPIQEKQDHTIVSNTNPKTNEKPIDKSTSAPVEKKVTIEESSNYNKDDDFFGTYSSNSKNIIAEEKIKTDNYIKNVEDSKSFTALAYGEQNLINGSIIRLLTNQNIYYQNKLIPKNSILTGKVTFKKQSIIVNLITAQTPTGNLNVNFISEIQEAPIKSYVLEDNYLLLIKS